MSHYYGLCSRTFTAHPNGAPQTVRAYGYLRASTKEQDATRARAALEQFALEHGLPLVKCFIENESGAKLDRPELQNLLGVMMAGDVLLLEQIDRLTRLDREGWHQLRATIQQKQIRVVALDLPTSHQLATSGDEFTGRMLDALNSMMLDMLAAIARKDYEDRRRRQEEGISKAKELGKYLGRPRDVEKEAEILKRLNAGETKAGIAREMGISRNTVIRFSKRVGL